MVVVVGGGGGEGRASRRAGVKRGAGYLREDELNGGAAHLTAVSLS